MDKTKIYAIGITIVLILIIGYIGFIYLQSYYYSKGYNQGALSVSQTGQLPYLVEEDNQTVVKVITLEQYWQGMCENYLKSLNGGENGNN